MKIGDTFVTNEGCIAKIIEFIDKNKVLIEFQDDIKFKKEVYVRNLIKGEIKNPYYKKIYNIAYLGYGEYSCRNNTKAYSEWKSMLSRCYNPYQLNKHPSYIDCYVCEEWLCFQNFAEWWELNTYDIDESLSLDKDILIKNNKIYSPSTCLIVPFNINKLFIRQKNNRYLPIGVYLVEDKKGYVYLKSKLSKTRGCYDCKYFSLDKPFQAFTWYKENKEDYIKQVADDYKDLIPQEVYEALYKYKVEIND